MTTVQEIKAAIPTLTLEERAEVARCLNEWEDDEWDEQMKRDFASGKFDKLLAKIDNDTTTKEQEWNDVLPGRKVEQEVLDLIG